MADRKKYMQEYWRKEEVKERNKKRFKKAYKSKEGLAYERKRSRYPRARWVHARANAKKRKLAFTIPFEFFEKLITQRCTYCNKKLDDETGHCMDRIDNTLGYTVDNVTPCCRNCNRRRHRSMSSEEFKKQSKLNGYWRDE